MKFLSCGCGVNSTALLVWLVENKKPLDGVVFADTGCEMPETYAYIKEHLKPYCVQHGLEFITLKSRYRENNKTIYEYYFAKKAIPMFAFRDCTDKFKKAALFQFAKEKGATRKEPLTFYIGIAFEERHRIGKPQRKYLDLEYPLVENQIDRSACVKNIEGARLPVPVKSGCFFCIFQREAAWALLKEKHPDLFGYADALERNAGHPLSGSYWLSELEENPRFDKKQTRLDRDCWAGCVCFKEK